MVRSRKLLTVLWLISMAVCTSTAQTPSGGESGIDGIITISPAKPGPTRIDEAGSVPLANTAFAIESNDREVGSLTTDEKGHFRVALPPGHYKVSLKGRKTSIGRFGPFEVEVVSGKMTNVQWECDSGIR